MEHKKQIITAEVANRIEFDALGIADQAHGLVDAFAIEMVAHLQDGRRGIAEHLIPDLQAAVLAGDLRVRHRHGAGQSGGEAQLEIRQALATE